MLIMVIQQKIIAWNFRGARCGDFIREMRDFLRCYRPAIILLMEPRISGLRADDVCTKLGKNKWIRADVVGFSSGVWCLWDEDDLTVEVKYTHHYFMHLLLIRAGGRKWELTAVYAPPVATKRKEF